MGTDTVHPGPMQSLHHGELVSITCVFLSSLVSLSVFPSCFLAISPTIFIDLSKDGDSDFPRRVVVPATSPADTEQLKRFAWRVAASVMGLSGTKFQLCCKNASLESPVSQNLWWTFGVIRLRCLKYSVMAMVDYRSITFFPDLLEHDHGKMKWKTLEPIQGGHV